MTDISRHPLLRQCYELGLAIELCGANEALTHASVKCSELLHAIDKHIGDCVAAFEAAEKLIPGLPPLQIVIPPPVDRSAQQLISGKPVPEDRSHTEIMPTGMQKDYVVLTPEERKKGFVRPVRRIYTHDTCGKATTTSREIAETFARDPQFYTGTFCNSCKRHFPTDEFKWVGTDQTVGS